MSILDQTSPQPVGPRPKPVSAPPEDPEAVVHVGFRVRWLDLERFDGLCHRRGFTRSEGLRRLMALAVEGEEVAPHGGP